jgi:hypothetical protein
MSLTLLRKSVRFCLLTWSSVLAPGMLLAQPAGYAYGRQVLLNGAKIPGAFPVLLDLTLPELRDVANGGHVSSATGNDIVFTHADCATPMLHTIDRYDPVTGRLLVWVRVPTLPPGTDLNIHLYYGKDGVSTPAPANVWSAYHGVWHFDGGSLADASGNGYTATNQGTTSASPAWILDGRANDATHWLEANSFPDLTTDLTISAWIRTTNNGRAGQRVFQDDVNNTGGYAMSLGDGGTGSLRFYARGSNPVYLDTPGNTIANNTWYHVAATVDIVNGRRNIYVNGVLSVSDSFTGWGTDGGTASIAGETALGETGNRFEGQLDEVRVARSALPASWIAAEYNNTSMPSGFYTVSSEYSAGSLCVILPITLIAFDARPIDGRVTLTWTTASESNNARFIVERSRTGEEWSPVAELPGAGTSTTMLHYAAQDAAPLHGLAYYRLKQVDYDGTTAFSPIRPVTTGGDTPIVLYPNPARHVVHIAHGGSGAMEVTITDLQGRTLRSERLGDDATSTMDISGLLSGPYIATFTGAGTAHTLRLVVER